LAFSFQSIKLISEVVLLLLFGVLAVKAIGSLGQSDLQTALLNTEVLRSKINEACITDHAYLDGFSLTQPTPSKNVFTTAFFRGLSKFSLMSSADPHYLLYYEAFPYGEGVGWEALQNLDNRILTYYIDNDITESTGKGKNDFEKELWRGTALEQPTYVSRIDEMVLSRLSTGEGAEILKKNPELLSYPRHVLVSNIKLTEQLGAIPAYSSYKALGEGVVDENAGEEEPVINPVSVVSVTPEERIKKITESFGEWKNGNIEGKDDFFEFTSYQTMSELEKSFVKYRPCGKNSLCLKTREGVYTFPLDVQCSDVKYVGIEYNAIDNKDTIKTRAKGLLTAAGVAVPILKAVPLLAALAAPVLVDTTGNVFSVFFSYKRSDLYFASPCKIDSRIEIVKKSCNNIRDDDGLTACQHIIQYPIYEYSGDKVIEHGKHFSCVENTGEVFESDYESNGPLRIAGGDCIIIKVSQQVKDYCWTPNPKGFDPEQWYNIDAKILQGLAAHPISNNAFFVGSGDPGKAVLVKKFEDAGFLKHFLNGILDTDWVWPSGYLLPSS
jgi:hypothetical protein